MSEQMIFSPGSTQSDSILEYFGFKSRAIPADVTLKLAALYGIFSKHSIDHETALAILKSYELKHGIADNLHLRVGNFKNFIDTINVLGSRQPFIDTVKNLGYLSKNELEEHAKETGDWTPFLKRVDKEAKNAATVGETPNSPVPAKGS